MPALNFKAQFAPLVESREKKQTIRQVWKRPIKVGDTLYLYTGMRTKECRKLLEAECMVISGFRIGADWESRIVTVNGDKLSHDDLYSLAVRDGFPDIIAFEWFFIEQYGLPFAGVLIEWD